MVEKIHINTIPEFHQVAGLARPAHPLLSVVSLEDITWKPTKERSTIIRDFYIIAWKKEVNNPLKYGHQDMAIEKSFLHFMAPKQLLTIHTQKENLSNSGRLLLIHHDFLLDTPLALRIRRYPFFNYDFNQLLTLNADQEQIIVNIFNQIAHEQHQLKGTNTKDVIIAQLGLLLAYTERFYQSRELLLAGKHDRPILEQLERVIDDYLSGPDLPLKGAPTIQLLSDRLNISPNYLSRLVQQLTGQSTQGLLHDNMIALAKERLSISTDTVAEIAYQLGFGSPQSFSRFFKANTTQTPTEFRNAFAN